MRQRKPSIRTIQHSTISSKCIHQQEQLFLMRAVSKIITAWSKKRNPCNKEQKLKMKISWCTDYKTPHQKRLTIWWIFNTYSSWTEDWGGSHLGKKRIHFDGSWLRPNGHKLQFGVKGQSTGLMRESMLHRLGQWARKTERSTDDRRKIYYRSDKPAHFRKALLWV